MPLDHSATLPLLSPFCPSDVQLSQIMRDLTDPFLSFVDIADGANTTVEALSAFLARPDMQERIRELENNIAARARVIASNALPSAVAAMQLINHAFAREERDHPLDTSSLPQLVEQRRRFAETSRRATTLIIRIARIQGGPPPPRPPRDPDGSSRAKTQGFLSLGPATAATRAPTPTPNQIDEPSSSPAQPPKPSLADDAALLRQLAAGRQAAGRVLHAITGIAPPPEDPDEELEAELERELEEDTGAAGPDVEPGEAELDDTSDEYVDNLPDTYNGYLAHPMIPRAIKTLWKLFPIFRPVFRGKKGLSTDELPPDIYRPAFFFLLDSHTDNLPIHILPDNPLGDLARYLATTYPTRAGPAP